MHGTMKIKHIFLLPYLRMSGDVLLFPRYAFILLKAKNSLISTTCRQVLYVISEVIRWRRVIFGWTCSARPWWFTQMCQYQCIVCGQVGVNYGPRVRMSLLQLVYRRIKHTHVAALKAPVCIAMARNTIYRYVSNPVSCLHKLDLLYHYLAVCGFFCC